MPKNFEADESVLFIDRKDREYLKRLRPGTDVQLRGGKIPAEEIIGLPEASRVRTTAGDLFLAIRPSYAQLIPNLPRAAQVVYPKDVGPLLLWGDIHPGARVVEAGSGPGALTMGLLRAIGPQGTLSTYEIREDHAKMAAGNVERFHGPAPNWTLRVADVTAGIEERDVDRVVLDLPEPWAVLPAIKQALRPGGIFVGYIPTVLQVKALAEALEDSGFGLVQVFENLIRFWHCRGRSLRPEHRMIGHTGFLVIARLLAPRVATDSEPAFEPLPTPDDDDFDARDEDADDTR